MNRWPWKAALWVALCGVLATSAALIPLWVMADSEPGSFTATMYSGVIRFEADGVASLRVMIYDLSENELWDSGPIPGDFVDWGRANEQGERLASGYYLYLAQAWDAGDRLVLNKTGKIVLLPGNQVGLAGAPPPAMADTEIAAKPPDVGPPPNPAPKPWRLTGNAGTTPAINFLGTSDPVDLVIRTNGTEALRIDTAGRVGIGTSSPFSPLHVTDMAGTAQFELSVIEEGHNDYAGLLIAGDGDQVNYSMLALGDVVHPLETWLITHKQSPLNSLWFSLVLENEPHRNILVLTPDGRLGLGTTSPAFTFDVQGTGRFTGSLTIGAYTLPATDGTNGQVLATNGSGSVSWQTIPGGGPGYWAANGNDIYNSNSGNVGVGVAAPTQKLDVAGNVEINGALYIGADRFLHNYGSRRNTFLGVVAGNSLLVGVANTGVGQLALTGVTTGGWNTALGSETMTHNTVGNHNTALGCYAMYHNIDGEKNTAVGRLAMLNSERGSNNTAVGFQAWASLAPHDYFEGDYNTAIGSCALRTGSTFATCNYNTAVGAFALSKNQGGKTAVNNIAVGYNAGSQLYSGSFNIYIGNVGQSTESRTIRIGNGADHNRTYIAGIDGVTVSGGAAVYVKPDGQLGTLPSSARFKTRIADLGSRSDVLYDLRPVTFEYKPEIDPVGITQYGLIAEEVAEVAPDLTIADENGEPYAVRYEQLVPLLLKELQELHASYEALLVRLEAVEQEVQDQQ